MKEKWIGKKQKNQLTKNLNAKKEYLLQNQELFGKEIFLDITQKSPPFANQLNTFEKNICNCEKCDLHKSRTNFVFGEGDKNASLLLIGEAPGAQEDLEGRPFVGRSGKLLDKILKAIGEYVYNNLKSNNVIMNKPMGGFYLMPEFLNNKFKTSSEMCKDILNNTGVALLPGSDFGFNPDKMLARLSFTDFDGQEFMNNIDQTKKIDENLINKFAPKVVEGVNKLKNWSENL